MALQDLTGSEILRFIEDNWHLGRLGNQSSDIEAGSPGVLFDYSKDGPRAPRLLLDPVTGNPY